jgi:hypothetical protein
MLKTVLAAKPAGKLKPCPHCGAKARVQCLANNDVEISCSQGQCRLVSGPNINEAARIWNDDPEYA